MGAESEPEPQVDAEREQEELARRSRDTGGDAPAAASIEEREAVARDEDDLFGKGSTEGDQAER